MRLPLASLIGLTLLSCAAGCQMGGRQRLERELRARELDVGELREELDRSEAYNHQLFQDLRNFRGEGTCPLPNGVAHHVGLSPVCSLVLGRQTGGHSDGSCSGDDALQVQIEPRDPETHTVKVGGSATVQVLEINKEGIKKPLSSWDVPPEHLRKAWKQGLLSSGYLLTLPWKVWPTTNNLRVVVHFRPVDGRVFEAEKDITIRLPPPDQRRILTAPEMPAGPAEVLPPPTPVGPPGAGNDRGPVIDIKVDSRPPITSWRSAGKPPAAEILRPTAVP